MQGLRLRTFAISAAYAGLSLKRSRSGEQRRRSAADTNGHPGYTRPRRLRLRNRRLLIEFIRHESGAAQACCYDKSRRKVITPATTKSTIQPKRKIQLELIT
jgi:hypothetical protein